MRKRTIKIVVLSDTHGKHNQLPIPKCDLFIFGGDSNITSFDKLLEFNKWLGKIDATKKIVIAGNHDSFLEQMDYYQTCSFFTNAIYLMNNHVKVFGLKIFGSPFSKEFNKWSYMRQDNNLQMIWNLIEQKTDIILIHGPAYGWLDKNVNGENCGSITLRNTIEQIKPKYLICGHIHEDSGILKEKDITIINASALDEKYQLKFEPKMFYIEK